MKKLVTLIILVFCFMFVLTSCAASSGDGYKGEAGFGGASDPSEVPDGENNQTVKPELPQAGQITACAYDDNLHFDFWQSLHTTDQEGNNGIFSTFGDPQSFNAVKRLKITVPKDVPTKVSLLDDEGNVLSSSHSGRDGICYLYPKSEKESYPIMLEYYEEGNEQPTVIKDSIVSEKEYVFEGVSKHIEAMQIMFVIDTTGSMGDELVYIQSEVVDILNRVKESYPDTLLELAVMVYRDITDVYITKYSDFTQDFEKQKAFLESYSAYGGGDFQEAVDIALTEASEKQ